MIHKPRPGARALAMVTAVAVAGLAPVLMPPSAQADGPVWSQSERKAPKKKPRQHRPGQGQNQGRPGQVPGQGGNQQANGQRPSKSKTAQVSLTTGGPSTALIPGRTYTWPYTVTNNGPVRAGSVTFKAPMPAGLEFVSAQGNCSWSGGQAVCSLGSLDRNQSVSGEVTAKVAPGAMPGAAVNGNATVDWNNGSTSAYFPGTTIGQASDLVVSKAGPGSARPGTVVPYQIEVVNQGPSPALSVNLVDAIQPVSPRRMGGAVPLEIVKASAACNARGLNLVCNLGTMAAGAKKTVTVSVKIGPKARPGTLLNTPAQANTPSNETDLTNNNATVQTRVEEQAPQAQAANASTWSQLPTSNGAQLPATGSDTQSVLDLALALLGVGLILLRVATMRRRSV